MRNPTSALLFLAALTILPACPTSPGPAPGTGKTGKPDRAGENQIPEGKRDQKDVEHIPSGCVAVGSERVRVRYRNEELLMPKTIRHVKTGIELVLIPAGTFWMGVSPGDEEARDDEKPRHRVTISRPFYLGKYEVTQGQWVKVMGSRPWSGETYARDRADHAASYISWNDAMEFCRATGFRLLTEAEWEYACRAGTTTKFCFGDSDSELGEYAWYDGNAWDRDEKYAHVVGRKKPNAFGLYDMHGNVWEWCSDWYDSEAYSRYSGGVTDPSGPSTGEYRVLRGGSWHYVPWFCRSSYRFRDLPSFRLNLGIRVARAP